MVGKLEALLFSQGSEMQKKTVMKILGIDAETLRTTAQTLERSCAGRGIVLAETETTLALRTAPEQAVFLKEVQKDSLSGDIGKAGLETLAILLYRGDSTRAEIDFIRGVNSSFILRHLMMRGLVEKVQNNTGRQIRYTVTVQVYSVLGVTKRTELSEYDTIVSELRALEEQKEQ